MGIPPNSIVDWWIIYVTLLIYLKIWSPKISQIISNCRNCKYTYTAICDCPIDFCWFFVLFTVSLWLEEFIFLYSFTSSMLREIISLPIYPAPIVNNDVIFMITFDKIFVYSFWSYSSKIFWVIILLFSSSSNEPEWQNLLFFY
jgi:hypothetical protein